MCFSLVIVALMTADAVVKVMVSWRRWLCAVWYCALASSVDGVRRCGMASGASFFVCVRFSPYTLYLVLY